MIEDMYGALDPHFYKNKEYLFTLTPAEDEDFEFGLERYLDTAVIPEVKLVTAIESILRSVIHARLNGIEDAYDFTSSDICHDLTLVGVFESYVSNILFPAFQEWRHAMLDISFRADDLDIEGLFESI